MGNSDIIFLYRRDGENKMKLLHLCGEIVEANILWIRGNVMISVDGGDPFDIDVAQTMFGEFPYCILKATDIEIDSLVFGGFMISDELTVKTLVEWAKHAAEPFNGMPKEKISEHLKFAVDHAINIGKIAVPGIDKISFAYKWDEDNYIHVVLEPDKFSDDMLVIKR